MKQHLTKIALTVALAGGLTSCDLLTTPKPEPKPEPLEWSYKASVQLKNGNYRKAITFYQKDIVQKGGSFESYYGLGRCYAQTKQFGESVKSFEKAMSFSKQSDPNKLKQANILLMEAYFNAGHYNASISRAEKVLITDSNSLKAYRYIAKSHYASKDYDASLKAYKQYLPKLSSSAEEKVEALQQAAFSAYGLRKSKEARMFYESYFKLKQEKAQYITNNDWYWRGQVANVNLDNEAKELYWSKLPENFLKSKRN